MLRRNRFSLPFWIDLELGKADRLGAEIGGDRRHPTLRHQGHCENVAVPRLEFHFRPSISKSHGERGVGFCHCGLAENRIDEGPNKRGERWCRSRFRGAWRRAHFLPLLQPGQRRVLPPHGRCPSSPSAGRERAKVLRPVLMELRDLSANAAAIELNRRGVPMPAGGKWHAKTVLRVRERLP